MSKFDELKKLAEAATVGPWEIDYDTRPAEVCTVMHVPPHGEEQQMFCYIRGAIGDWSGDENTNLANANFIAAANPAAILELLAIQAQQVKILKSITSAIRDGLKIEYGSIIYHEAIDALAAVGAQP